MKATKKQLTGLKHTYISQHNGEEAVVTIDNTFTTADYREAKRKAKEAIERDDDLALAEQIRFFIKEWNFLDDNDETIPLQPRELAVQRIAETVPMILLSELVEEVEKALSKGGLSKKK